MTRGRVAFLGRIDGRALRATGWKSPCWVSSRRPSSKPWSATSLSTRSSPRPIRSRRSVKSAAAFAAPPPTAWRGSRRAQIELMPKLEICAIHGVGLETTDLAALPRARHRAHHRFGPLRRCRRSRPCAGARRLPPDRRGRPLRPRRQMAARRAWRRRASSRACAPASSGSAASACEIARRLEGFKTTIGYVDPVRRDVPYRAYPRRAQPRARVATSSSSPRPARRRVPAPPIVDARRHRRARAARHLRQRRPRLAGRRAGAASPRSPKGGSAPPASTSSTMSRPCRRASFASTTSC